MPSSPKAIRAILSLIPTDIEGEISELGSGWGTLAVSLSKHCPQAKIIGYETSPVPYVFSQFLLLFQRNVSIRYADIYKVELKRSKLVVCYLYPGAMARLKKKFEAELPPGALVISNTFAVPGWVPIKTVELQDLYKTKVYLYCSRT